MLDSIHAIQIKAMTITLIIIIIGCTFFQKEK